MMFRFTFNNQGHCVCPLYGISKSSLHTQLRKAAASARGSQVSLRLSFSSFDNENQQLNWTEAKTSSFERLIEIGGI